MACDSPLHILPKGHLEKIPVPCGKCPPCKLRRVNSWVFRLLEEEKVSTSAHFVTLTYNTDHVPITPNGFMGLRKSDFQDYMKRLRKLCPEHKLKYYACGEYGSKTQRPHYHAIVFNVPDKGMFFDAWSLHDNPLGSVHVGSVSSDSVAYTMKYIDKSHWHKKHSRDDRPPEFALMSKGLGSNYITDPLVVAYHNRAPDVLYLTKLSGHKIAMPRYYRTKLFTEAVQKQQTYIIKNAVSVQLQKAERAHYSQFPDMDFQFRLDSERLDRFRKFYGRSTRGEI